MFVVRRFKNRKGANSWRVQGTHNGAHIRRNFKTQEETAPEQAALNLSAVQLNSNLRSVSTWLSEPQMREAESVFARLTPGGRSVAFYFDLGVASHRKPLRQRRFVSFHWHSSVPTDRRDSSPAPEARPSRFRRHPD